MSDRHAPNGFRTFLILWGTQSLSVFGSALTYFAMTIWMTQALYPRPDQQPQLAFALALVGLAGMIPALLMAPIAGAWVDRHDRKRTMIVADFANVLLSALLVALIASGRLELWMLLVLVVAFGTLQAFHGAAFDTSYAMLVPEHLLPRANGMMQSMWALSNVISPAIAAAIITLPALARQGLLPAGLAGWLAGLRDGSALAIAVDGATFLVAAVTLLFLVIPSPVRTDLNTVGGKPQKSLWADIREGAVYIWRRPPLLWLLGTFAVSNLTGAPLQMMHPLVLKFTLARDLAARGLEFAPAMALLAAVAGIGGVAGGALISAWGGLKSRRILGVLIPVLIAGLFQVCYGLSPLFYLSVAAVAICDAMVPILNAHSQTIWQTQTPRELQGRVFAVRRVIAQCTAPLGTVLAGWAGGLIDPGRVVAIAGGIMVCFCVVQLFNPQLLKVEDKALLDGMAARTGD
ncbi:MAG: Major Facilitator Superfamily transporter [Firmicutes bacterium]|nr:Major Facilitator Superfamily transporter [Bacillota bacterium]